MPTQQSKSKEIQKLRLDIDQITRTKSILNSNQIQKIYNSTPQRYIYRRPGKGGGEWRYAKASYVRKVLDSIFAFRWDFERVTTDSEVIEYMKLGIKQAIVHCKLTGWVKNEGEWIPLIKTSTGRADIKFKKGTSDPLDLGNDLKAAESDALKKAASRFGICQDLYEQDEYMEIEIVGSDEHNERDKNLKKKIKEAQKIIKKQGDKVVEQNTGG